jgi:hypothetical protein
MKRLTRFALVLATLGAIVPLHAQQGNLSLGYFMTADDAHAPQLEAGIREHVAWHRSQNDTWSWATYQAMTGGIEYVMVSPGHMWADLDNPAIDMAADLANWAETGAPHTATVEANLWSSWADVSMPPPVAEPVPVYEVLEFDYTATTEGRAALLNAFAKIKTAIEGGPVPLQYTINEVESSDEPPTLFVAIAHQSFGELDGGDPNGLQTMLAQVYGHVETMQIMRALEGYLSPRARRFWVFRPDLSYVPGM